MVVVRSMMVLAVLAVVAGCGGDSSASKRPAKEAVPGMTSGEPNAQKGATEYKSATDDAKTKKGK